MNDGERELPIENYGKKEQKEWLDNILPDPHPCTAWNKEDTHTHTHTHPHTHTHTHTLTHTHTNLVILVIARSCDIEGRPSSASGFIP